MRRGLVIGKFLPFHKGHQYLIERALEECDAVYVIVVASEVYDEFVPTTERMRWIREHFRGRPVEVTSLDKDLYRLDDFDSEGWAKATLRHWGTFDTPDVVFSSEEYGPKWANLMDAEHVMVDLARVNLPVSGTLVRENPSAHLDMLPEVVRPYFVKKIVILGAECTGKTTLARDLATFYETKFVPEFGRHYTEALPCPKTYKWHTSDFLRIASSQRAIEADAKRWADPLIADTNVFTTALFHEAYMGYPDDRLLAAEQEYDLYIQTDIEAPFEQDITGLRNERKCQWFHDKYVEYLADKNSILVQGKERSRVAQATKAIDALNLREGL